MDSAGFSAHESPRDRKRPVAAHPSLAACHSWLPYSASGDLTDNSTHSYQYDAEGRLISVDNGSTATYLYNSFGERVESHVGSDYKEYIYDKDGNQVGYMDRSGPAWNSWVVFNNQHLAHYENSGTYFMHANSQGTAAFVTDYSGSVVQDELHYPWGEVWQVAGTQVEERYAGMEHQDSETGLDPTPNRMYSSVNYTWLSPDPAQADIFQPQSMSAYSYAGDNPFTFTDPAGLDVYPCESYYFGGPFALCTTSWDGYSSPGLEALHEAGMDDGYLVTPAPYIGGLTFAAAALGLPETLAFDLPTVGGGLGMAAGVAQAVGLENVAHQAGQAADAVELAEALVEGNAGQAALAASNMLAGMSGSGGLSEDVEVGDDIFDAIRAALC